MSRNSRVRAEGSYPPPISIPGGPITAPGPAGQLQHPRAIHPHSRQVHCFSSTAGLERRREGRDDKGIEGTRLRTPRHDVPSAFPHLPELGNEARARFICFEDKAINRFSYINAQPQLQQRGASARGSASEGFPDFLREKRAQSSCWPQWPRSPGALARPGAAAIPAAPRGGQAGSALYLLCITAHRRSDTAHPPPAASCQQHSCARARFALCPSISLIFSPPFPP